LYILFINIFKKASAHTRHGMALLMLATGALWSGISFVETLFFPDHSNPATWLSDLIVSEGQPGPGIISGISRLLVEALPYCSFAYLLVLFFLFIRYSGQYLYSRRLKGTGLSRIQPECRLFVEETRQLMGVRKKVQVWLSSLVEGPVTLGYFKPMILIPIATANHLSLQQVEAILLHELAHIRRNDYLLNLGVAALEILFFFNPFSRLLIRDIKSEREHRCDDLVMQFRYDPQCYVSALLSLATGVQGNPQLALAATGNNDQLLLGRVKRILKMPRTQDRPGVRALLFLFFTLSITCFAGLGLGRPAATPIAARPDEKRQDAISATVATESAGTRIISVAVLVKESVSPPVIARNPAPANPKCKPSGPTHSHPGSIEAPDDEDAGYIQVSEKDADDETQASGYATAAIAYADKREYSITTATAVSTPTPPPAPGGKVRSQDLAPFVPNSSWSYKYIQDSTRPEQQFVYLQKLAYKDAEIAVRRMQKELQLQLHVLQLSHSPEEQQALREQRQILEEQLKLQREYLQKQQALQIRYEKAAAPGKKQKQRKIVFI
jgi:beta-lactamase regulating signal transducer with metallopeptidase domain